MDIQIFKKSLSILEKNYNFKYSPELLTPLIIALKENGISVNDFSKLVQGLLLKVTQEEWNRKYGFKGYPAIANWLDMLGVKRERVLSLEEQCNIEVNRIMEGVLEVSFSGGVIFDNPTTNATVESYGGISELAWDLDPCNDKKREKTWVKKELKELWLTCHADNKKSYSPSFRSGGGTVHLIGNENNCKEMLGSISMRLENHSSTENKPIDEVRRLADKFSFSGEKKEGKQNSLPPS